jgi:hypothetical protein
VRRGAPEAEAGAVLVQGTPEAEEIGSDEESARRERVVRGAEDIARSGDPMQGMGYSHPEIMALSAGLAGPSLMSHCGRGCRPGRRLCWVACSMS